MKRAIEYAVALSAHERDTLKSEKDCMQVLLFECGLSVSAIVESLLSLDVDVVEIPNARKTDVPLGIDGEFEKAVALLTITAGDEGIHAIRRVRTHLPTMPIVAIAGSGEAGIAIESALHAGADEFLIAHEVSPNTLSRAFRSSIKRRALDKAGMTSLFENNPFPMWIYDVETLNILDANRSAVIHYGYSRRELLEMNLVQLLVEDGTNVPDDTRAATTHVWKHRTKAGSIIFVEVSANDIEFRSKRARLVIAQDITEQLAAADALRRCEDRYKRILNEDLTAYFVSTPSGELRTCNPAFAKMFGFTSVKDAMTENASTLYRTVEDREEFLELVLQEKTLLNHECELRKIDGSAVHVLGNVVGTFDEAGELTEITGYLFDVSNRRKLEGHIVASERMESISLLAGGIASDFDDLLGTIQSHIALLPNHVQQEENVNSRLGSINTAVNRGSKLVHELLTFARKASITLTPIDVNREVKALIAHLADTFPPSIELQVIAQDGLPAIEVDKDQLHQALRNICVNAHEAILQKSDKGKIEIRTSELAGNDMRKQFPEAVADRYVRISIADNGVGMKEETKLRVFEPFFTTKDEGKGTGLGLSVAYGVARALQGFVGVESEWGKGTTFHLYIPTSDSNAPTVIETPRRANETILVVEDDEMLRDLMSSTLESDGYRVLAAQDGHEAIEIFRSEWENIDVVISDMGLPKQSGLEVFLKMKSINPDVNMVIMSGFLETEARTSLLRSGVKAVMEKPFLSQEVVKTLRAVIAGKSGRKS